MFSAQTLRFLGFGLCLIPIFLLWADLYSPLPFLNLALFFVALPILRQIKPWDFEAPDLDRFPVALVRYLHAVPHVASMLMLATMALMPAVMNLNDRSVLQTVGFFLSAWVAMSLSLCVVHDLTHRQSQWSTALARMLSASMGFFFFVEEHRAHHAVSGSGHDHEAAQTSENIYAYSIHTSFIGFKTAYERERSRLFRRDQSLFAHRFLAPFALTLGLLILHAVFNGLLGATLYIALCLFTMFSFRAITFIQHWGLREAPVLFQRVGFAWDSSCVFQSWITLNIAFHEDHHRRPNDFFFKLRCRPHGLSTPYTYPIMFVLALFPSGFKKLMLPHLDDWMRLPDKSGQAANFSQVELCFPAIGIRNVRVKP